MGTNATKRTDIFLIDPRNIVEMNSHIFKDSGFQKENVQIQ